MPCATRSIRERARDLALPYLREHERRHRRRLGADRIRPCVLLHAAPSHPGLRVADAWQDFLRAQADAPEDRAERDDVREPHPASPGRARAPQARHQHGRDRDHVEDQRLLARMRVRPLGQRDAEKNAEHHARPDASRAQRRSRPHVRERPRARGVLTLRYVGTVEGSQLSQELVYDNGFLAIVLPCSGQLGTSDRERCGPIPGRPSRASSRQRRKAVANRDVRVLAAFTEADSAPGLPQWHVPVLAVTLGERAGAPAQRASRPKSRAGVIGTSRTTTPRSATASSTALAIAAAPGMAPLSPTPLIPSGLIVDGCSSSATGSGGSWSAFGIA